MASLVLDDVDDVADLDDGTSGNAITTTIVVVVASVAAPVANDDDVGDNNAILMPLPSRRPFSIQAILPFRKQRQRRAHHSAPGDDLAIVVATHSHANLAKETPNISLHDFYWHLKCSLATV